MSIYELERRFRVGPVELGFRPRGPALETGREVVLRTQSWSPDSDLWLAVIVRGPDRVEIIRSTDGISFDKPDPREGDAINHDRRLKNRIRWVPK